MNYKLKSLLSTILLFNCIALTSCGSIYDYKIEDKKVTITFIDYTKEELIISDSIKGAPVVTIGDEALAHNPFVSYVKIPDSVVYINSGAFKDCTNLKTVIVGNGVTVIDDYAFEDCSLLASITLGSNVSSLGEEMFSDCSSLTSITYNGTMQQWENIAKRHDWDMNTGEYVIHCNDGDIQKQ